MWVLACLILAVAAVAAGLVLSSGGAFNQRILYRFYERVGPQVYANQDDINWEILIERLGLQGDEDVLDVGTAVGDFPLCLAKKPEFRGKIEAIDWSSQMIESARHRSIELGLEDQVHFERVDVRDGLPYPNDLFDVVICIGVLETMGGEQALVMYELGRVLKPSGKLVLSRFRGWSNWSADRIEAWFGRQLETFGMEVESVLSFRPSHDLMIIRWREIDGPAHQS